MLVRCKTQTSLQNRGADHHAADHRADARAISTRDAIMTSAAAKRSSHDMRRRDGVIERNLRSTAPRALPMYRPQSPDTIRSIAEENALRQVARF
jgi:hypothetical protein